MNFLKKISWQAYGIVALFLVAYTVLGIVKHNHFLSGYDLAIVDQIMWKYAFFHNPLTTIQAYPFTYLTTDHVEFIYLFLAPLYWIWNDVRMLIFFQALFFCVSGLPVYAIARKKGLNQLLSLTLLFSYLFFYGVQNALWNDVHSNVFGAGFLAWLLYFLETNNMLGTGVSFFLAITSKEDMAFLTLGIGIAWLLQNIFSKQKKRVDKHPSFFDHCLSFFLQNKTSLALIFFSLLYLFLVFVVYFPHFTLQGYRFAGKENMVSAALHLNYFANTASKREIIFVSLGWFGFLPLFAPLFLIPAFMDLYHFFVIGNLVESAQEIFLHYRVTLAPLLIWPTIMGIAFLLNRHPKQSEGSVIPSRAEGSHSLKQKTYPMRIFTFVKSAKAKNMAQNFLSLYLLLCAFAIQYFLHLPLSYLTKSWFWHESKSVANINHILTYVPKNASIVSQNNITPHIAHRDNIFTLWGSSMGYKTVQESPCGKIICPWFHWVGHPQYLIVDTGSPWDIRHFLQNRPDFLLALHTFEKLGKIKAVRTDGTTTLFKVLQNP